MKWNYKGLIDWVNLEFERLGIAEYEATTASRTYYKNNQYECGACKMYIFFRMKNKPNHPLLNSFFMTFYSLKELKDGVYMGYEMYIKFSSRGSGQSIKDLEIGLRKKP